MRAAMLGLVALVACAGCATGTRSMVYGTNGTNGVASPATTVDVTPGTQSCEGGWYDAAAGVCDTIGD
jgi:hypothetical protein